MLHDSYVAGLTLYTVKKAIDIEPGDAVLVGLHGPTWEPTPLLVTKNVWNGSSRKERRIEFYTNEIVVDKNQIFVVAPGV